MNLDNLDNIDNQSQSLVYDYNVNKISEKQLLDKFQPDMINVYNMGVHMDCNGDPVCERMTHNCPNGNCTKPTPKPIPFKHKTCLCTYSTDPAGYEPDTNKCECKKKQKKKQKLPKGKKTKIVDPTPVVNNNENQKDEAKVPATPSKPATTKPKVPQEEDESEPGYIATYADSDSDEEEYKDCSCACKDEGEEEEDLNKIEKKSKIKQKNKKKPQVEKVEGKKISGSDQKPKNSKTEKNQDKKKSTEPADTKVESTHSTTETPTPEPNSSKTVSKEQKHFEKEGDGYKTFTKEVEKEKEKGKCCECKDKEMGKSNKTKVAGESSLATDKAADKKKLAADVDPFAPVEGAKSDPKLIYEAEFQTMSLDDWPSCRQGPKKKNIATLKAKDMKCDPQMTDFRTNCEEPKSCLTDKVCDSKETCYNFTCVAKCEMGTCADGFECHNNDVCLAHSETICAVGYFLQHGLCHPKPCYAYYLKAKKGETDFDNKLMKNIVKPGGYGADPNKKYDIDLYGHVTQFPNNIGSSKEQKLLAPSDIKLTYNKYYQDYYGVHGTMPDNVYCNHYGNCYVYNANGQSFSFNLDFNTKKQVKPKTNQIDIAVSMNANKVFNKDKWVSIDNDPNNQVMCDYNQCEFNINGQEYAVKFTEVYDEVSKLKGETLQHHKCTVSKCTLYFVDNTSVELSYQEMVQYMYDELERKRLDKRLRSFEDYLGDVYDGYQFKNQAEQERTNNKEEFVSNEMSQIVETMLKDQSIDRKEYLESEMWNLHRQVGGMDKKMDTRVTSNKQYLESIDEFLYFCQLTHSRPSDKRFKMLTLTQSAKLEQNRNLCNNVQNYDTYRNKQKKNTTPLLKSVYQGESREGIELDKLIKSNSTLFKNDDYQNDNEKGFKEFSDAEKDYNHGYRFKENYESHMMQTDKADVYNLKTYYYQKKNSKPTKSNIDNYFENSNNFSCDDMLGYLFDYCKNTESNLEIVKSFVKEKNSDEKRLEEYIMDMRKYLVHLRRLWAFNKGQEFKRCWKSQWYRGAVRLMRTFKDVNLTIDNVYDVMLGLDQLKDSRVPDIKINEIPSETQSAKSN